MLSIRQIYDIMGSWIVGFCIIYGILNLWKRKEKWNLYLRLILSGILTGLLFIEIPISVKLKFQYETNVFLFLGVIWFLNTVLVWKEFFEEKK